MTCLRTSNKLKCKVSKNATNSATSCKKSLQKVYVPLRKIETVHIVTDRHEIAYQ